MVCFALIIALGLLVAHGGASRTSPAQQIAAEELHSDTDYHAHASGTNALYNASDTRGMKHRILLVECLGLATTARGHQASPSDIAAMKQGLIEWVEYVSESFEPRSSSTPIFRNVPLLSSPRGPYPKMEDNKGCSLKKYVESKLKIEKTSIKGNLMCLDIFHVFDEDDDTTLVTTWLKEQVQQVQDLWTEHLDYFETLVRVRHSADDVPKSKGWVYDAQLLACP